MATLIGDGNPNTIVGTDVADVIASLDGNDTVAGGGGDDLIVGGSGDDVIDGGGGDDWILSEDGDDVVDGGGGIDVIVAGEGDDTITGGAGGDAIRGDAGIDTAQFAGDARDYRVFLASAVGWELVVLRLSTGEVDWLSGIEILAFDTATFHLDGRNNAPIADDVALAVGEDAAPLTLDLLSLSRAFDFEGEALTLASVETNAQLSFDPATGLATYDVGDAFQSLAAGETATESFDFAITDGTNTLTRTLSVTIAGANDAPVVAGPVAAAVVEDGPAVQVDLLAGASDVDAGTELAITGLAALPPGLGLEPDGRTVAVDPGDAAFQALALGEVREIALAYTIVDGDGGAVPQTATIAVTGDNDEPAVAATSAAALEDGPAVEVDLAALGSDVDSDDDGTTLAYAIVAGPAEGTAAIAGTTLTFAPGAGFQDLAAGDSRAVTVSVAATDRHGAVSSAADVTVTVTGVNDAPDAVADAASTDEETAVAITVLANDADVDAGDAPRLAAVDDARTQGTVIRDGAEVLYDPAGAFESLAAGETATDTFTYTVSDASGATDTTLVTVTVTGVNDAPVAEDDTAETDEDTPALIAVLANDADVDADDALTVAAVDTTATLGAAIRSGTAVLYDPAGAFDALAIGETATDTFTYTISDGNGGTDTATVTVTIAGVNDAPVAEDDGVVTNEDEGRGIDVLSNDTDIDGDGLTVTDVTQAANGTVTFGDAFVEYVPDADFNGSDSFIYTVSDGNGGTDTASVSVQVLPVNDPPMASEDAVEIDENTSAFIDVLGNDSDVDGDRLSVLSVDTTGVRGIVTFIDTGVEYDSVGDLGDLGAGPFDALAEGETAIDTFSYTVSDGNGGTDTASVTVTVVGVNDAPFAQDDSATTDADTAVAIANVLANDIDVDASDVLFVSVFDTTATLGTITDTGDGTFAYDPNGQFDTLATGETATDTFTYTVSDGNGGTDTATVTVTVTGVNEAPVAGDDTAATDEDSAVTTASVLLNDTDANASDVLSVSALDTTVTLGLVTDTGNGTFDYDPNGQFESLAAGESATDTFRYTISDGNGGTDTATVTVTVTGVNDAPVAGDDTAATNEDTAISGNVLANDTDVDTGDVLTVVTTNPTSFGGAALSVGPDGSFTYDPSGLFDSLAAGESTTDFFTYLVSDGNGGTDVGTATLTVAGVNDVPEAKDDAATTDEDTASTIAGVLANDTDVDASDVLVVSALDTTGTLGHVTDNGDGTFAYDPNGQFESLAEGETATDTFTYTVSDGNGGTDTATVTVTITGVNDAPVAEDDAASTNEDTAATIATATLLANDTDVDLSDIALGRLFVSAVGPATNGMVSLDDRGTVGTSDDDVVYTPEADFNGTDSFAYTVSDGSGGTDTATVTVTVEAVNDAPVIATPIGFTERVVGKVSRAWSVTVADVDGDGDTDILVTNRATSSSGTVRWYENNGAIDPTFTEQRVDTTADGARSVHATDVDGDGDTDIVVAFRLGNTVRWYENDGAADPNFTEQVVDSNAEQANSVYATDVDGDGDTDILAASRLDDTVRWYENDGAADPSFTVHVVDTSADDVTSVFAADVDGDGDTDILAASVGDDTVRWYESDGAIDPSFTEVVVDGNADRAESVYAADLDGDGDTDILAASGGDNTVRWYENDGAADPGFTERVVDTTADNVFSVFAEDVDGDGDTDILAASNEDKTVRWYENDGATDPSFTERVVDTTADHWSVSAADVDGDGDTDILTASFNDSTVRWFENAPTALSTDEDATLKFSAVGGTAITVGDPDGDVEVEVDLSVADGSLNLNAAATGALTTLGGDGTGAVTFRGLVSNVNAALDGLVYTPDVDFNGQDTLQITVDDLGNTGIGGPLTAEATVDITITPVNDAPVAEDDSAGTDEDTVLEVLTGGVLANDSDVDGDTLTVSAFDATSALGAAVIVLEDGRFGYDPTAAAALQALAAGATATDTFGYTVSDGNGGTDTATVTVQVAGVNDAPVLVDDAFSGAEDTLITGNVLANDSDIDGDPLEVVAGTATTPEGATITLQADGTLTYDPAADFVGTETVFYNVPDGNGGFVRGTVTITVTNVNDVPVAGDDTAATDEDTAVTTASVLLNDTDVDVSDVLVVSALDTTGTLGAVTDNGDGTFAYDPNGQFESLAEGATATDTFAYTVSDGNGGTDTATVTVTVTGVNDAPVAVDDTFTTNEDMPFVGDVLENDTDIDGDDLFAAEIDGPGNGTLAFTGGQFRYTPNPDFNGTDTFRYVVDDRNGSFVEANVTITVTPVNDAPVALDDGASTNEDTAVTIDVLDNDSDVESDSLTVSAVDATETAGSVTITNSGTDVSYDPNSQFEFLAEGASATDTFTYTVSDGNGGTDTATVTVTVTGVNDAPDAVDDAFEGAEDTQIAGNVLANDTDVDGDPLLLKGGTLTTTEGGTVELLEDGSFTYDPAENFNGTDTFSYIPGDGRTNGNTATVTLTVTPVNDAPDAIDDIIAGADEDTLFVGNVLNDNRNGADSDVDGDALTVAVGTLATRFGATVELQADGAFIYDPTTSETLQVAAEGERLFVDTFVYTVSDGNGGTDTATVDVIVEGVNDAPVAEDDAASTNEDTAATIATATLLANDTDVDLSDIALGRLFVSAVGAAENGTVYLDDKGTADTSDDDVVYTPEADFNVTDSFTYTVSDGSGGHDTASVTITLEPVNDAPEAADDSGSTDEDTVLSVVAANGVLADDTDVENDSLLVTTSDAVSAQGATVTVDADGAYTYDPTSATALQALAAGATATDTFTYAVSDGNGGTDTATVTLTVTGVNDAPVALDDPFTADEDTPISGNVLDTDSDIDGDALTVSAFDTTGTLGSVTGTGNGAFDYDPNGQFEGLAVGESATDTFSYTVSDGNGGTDTATVTITIDGVNDAPVAVDDTFTTDEDMPLVGDVLENDTDIDGDDLFAAEIDGPENGTLAFSGGQFHYTPNPDFNGTDTFRYVVDDRNGSFVEANVTITVTPVNDGPVAIDDAHEVDEDATLTVAASGVLANDTDVDGDSLSAVLVSDVSNGTLDLNADGSFGYSPDLDFNGTDSFTYKPNDGTEDGNTVTVTLTVNPVNDAPVAEDDVSTVTFLSEEQNGLPFFEGETGRPGLFVNDSDADGDTLTLTHINGIAVVSGFFDYAGDGVSGELAFVNTNSIHFRANGDFQELAEGENSLQTYTYAVSDGNGGTDTATFSFTVNGVNDAPVAADDGAVATTNEDTPVDVSAATLLANDRDIDTTDTLSVQSGTALNGTLTDNGDGTFAYTPNADFTGTDTITYTASDGNGGTDTATATVIVTPINDAPVATADAAVTGKSAAVTIDVLANDADVEDDSLTVNAIDTTSTLGSVTNNGTDVTYDPNGQFDGLSVGEAASDTFTYTVSDGNGGTDTATVTVTVDGNTAPTIAAIDAGTFSEDDTFGGGILEATDNVSLPHFGAVTVATGAIDGQTYAFQTRYGNNSVDVVQIDANGVLTKETSLSISSPSSVDVFQTSGSTYVYVANDGSNAFEVYTAEADGTLSISLVETEAGAGDSVFELKATNFGAAGYLISASEGDDHIRVFEINEATGEIALVAEQSDGGDLQLNAASSLAAIDIAGRFYIYASGLAQSGISVFEFDPDAGTLTNVENVMGVGSRILDLDAAIVEGTPYLAAAVNGASTVSLFSIARDGTLTASDSVADSADPDLELNGAYDLEFRTIGDSTYLFVAGEGDDGVSAFRIGSDGTLINTDNEVAVNSRPFVRLSDVTSVTTTVVDGQPLLVAGSGTSGMQAFTISEGNGTLSINLLDGASDADGQDLDVSNVSVAFSNAAAETTNFVLDAETGLFEIDLREFNALAAGETQTATITYTVEDGFGGALENTANFKVIGVNDAPDASDTPAETLQAAPVTINVLDDVTDAEGDAVALLSAWVDEGSVWVDGVNGTMTYTPEADFIGTATITYQVEDALGALTEATKAVIVSGLNEAPVITSQSGASASTDEDVAVVFSSANGNAISVSDADIGDGEMEVTITAGSATSLASTDGLTFSDGDGTADETMTFTGKLAAINTALDGLVYTPTADFNGDATLTIDVNDQGNDGAVAIELSDSLTIDIAIASVDDPPVISSQEGSDIDGFVNTDLVLSAANDSLISFSDIDDPAGTEYIVGLSVDNGALTVASVEGLESLFSTGGPEPNSETIAAVGTLSDWNVALDGLLYVPDTDFVGTDVLAIGIFPDGGGSALASFDVSINVIAPGDNTDPVAVDDTATTDEDVAVDIDVLSNDSDADGDTLSVASATAANGSVAIRANGTLTYTPNADFNGFDTIAYTLSDGRLGFDTASVTVTVDPVEDPPVAVADAATTDEDTAIDIDVLGNDSDADGDTLTVTAIGTAGTLGSVTNTGANVTYDPNGQFEGLASGETATDSFTYTVSDGNGGADTETVTVTVTGVNDAPVASDDVALVSYGQDIEMSVLDNDSDAEGDELFIASVTQGADGTVSLINDGFALNYSPSSEFGVNDTFTYTVSDGNGGTDTATVIVVADDIDVRTNQGDPVSIALLPDGASDEITIGFGGTPDGTISRSGGTLTYTPDAGFEGADAFSFTVRDNGGTVDIGRIDVTVRDNFDPEANDDSYFARANGSLTFPAEEGVLVNDSDFEGDSLTAVLVSDVSNGTLSLNSDGSFVYTPNTDFEGTDSFTYVANDGTEDGNTATVTLDVIAGFNHAPVANDVSFTLKIDVHNGTAIANSKTIDVLDNVYDPNGDILNVVSFTQPASGSVSDEGDGVLEFRSSADSEESFTYTVSDGNGGTDTGTVTVSKNFNVVISIPPQIPGSTDSNNDGFDDAIDFGSVNVFYGSEAGFETTDSSALDGSNGYVIEFDADVATTGDINGDGFSDMAMAAQADGAMHVVFGAASQSSSVDVAALDGSTGFSLTGLATDVVGGAGQLEMAMGDVNGDGVDDMVINQVFAQDVDSVVELVSETYTVYGDADGFDAVVDLSALDGDDGFKLVNTGDAVSGGSVAVVDVDDDDVADIVLGAPGASDSGGKVYVVKGRDSFSAMTDVAALAAAQMIVLTHASDEDFGRAVDAVGDVTGDDTPDLTIMTGDGDAYVVEGADLESATAIAATTADVSFTGVSGRVVGGGDVDGDGVDDLFASDASDNSLVIFGGGGLGTPDAQDVMAAATADGLVFMEGEGRPIPYGDIDGDGFDDFGTSGPGGLMPRAGGDFKGEAAFVGDAADDTYAGGSSDDAILGGGGGDTLSGGGGRDLLKGGAGGDLLNGDPGDDVLEGGEGIDTLNGGADNDRLRGDHGDDVLDGGGGNDRLDGGPDNDQLTGGIGEDQLRGGSGNDTLVGGDNADRLFGDPGDDVLMGGPGNDVLAGGPGADQLTGGSGNDIFVFRIGDGPVTITDFDAGAPGPGTIVDRIDLKGFGLSFAALDSNMDGRLDPADATISGGPDGVTLTFGGADALTVDDAGILTPDDLVFS